MLDVGQEKDPFPFAGLRLKLSLRQPPRFFCHHPVLNELQDVLDRKSVV